MTSDWYRRLFPRAALNPERNVELEFKTADGGGRLAVSLGGAITGLGADTIIIDDLMKADAANSDLERQRVKDFYEQTLFSRQDKKAEGRIIAIQQRLHEDDLAAYLIAKNEFVHLNMPAIAVKDEVWDLGGGRTKRRAPGEALFEAQEPLHVLEEIRTSVGGRTFMAQWGQDPVAPDGALVRPEHLHYYDEAPGRNHCRYVVQTWDVAVTSGPQSDYSVCATFGFFDNVWYLLDLWRGRLESPELLAQARHLRREWRPDQILIEKSGAGRPFFDEMRQDQFRETPQRHHCSWQVRGFSPKTDKISRLAGQTGRLQSGAILFPRNAPFMEVVLRELVGFPNARYDDICDAISQFIDWSVRGRFGRSRAIDEGRGPR